MSSNHKFIHDAIQSLANEYSEQHAEQIISYLNNLNIIQLEDIKNYAIFAYLKVAEHIIQMSPQYSENVYLYTTKILELEPEHEKAFEILKLNCIYKCNYNTDLNANIAELKKLLIYCPYDYQLQYIIGLTYHKLHAYEDSIHHFKLAIALIENKMQYIHNIYALIEYKVNSLYTIAQIYYNLNNIYLCKYYISKAYDTNPNDSDVNNLMGVVYMHMRQIDKAIAHFENIPDYKKTPAVYSNLGSAYSYRMNYEKAIECYDKIPDNLAAFQNKLFTSHYILHTISDDMYIFELHKQINRFYENATQKCLPDYIRKPSGVKLTIGFVSANFIYNNIRDVIMYFIHSILDKIDRNKFSIICYSLKPITQVQAIFPDIVWKYIHSGMTCSEFKNIIRKDDIDILFDLTGHTSEDRLDVFVERSAPIQISYCAYPNTTGLLNMDYHIVDKYCDSDGITPGPGDIVRPSTQRYYTEKLIFMDKCFLNYTPYVDNELQLAEQPCMINNFLTIGTFNKLNKINSHNIKLWQCILQNCNNIHFVIKTKDLATPELQEQFMNMFTDKEVHKRIKIMSYSETNTNHLLEYNKLDIALDTFPYSGTCTTCDALYMGVPVMTLFDDKRQYHVQNVSSSILINTGLSEFVCFSEEEYINKVIYYANHQEELRDIKKKVREQFLKTVCNAETFVREFEDKIRQTYEEHKW